MPDITISPAGLRVIKLLVGSSPRTVTDLIEATGVTRTAVTEQLNELVAAGFVDRTLERLPGRGRPRHLYTATHTALSLLFANNQHLLVPAVWHALEELGGEELIQKVLKKVSGFLADHYAAKITAKEPKERLRRLIDILEQEGSLIEFHGNNGRCSVNKRSCPFISMFEPSRTVCAIDLDVMSAVVGRPVRRVACRHDGAPSCVFEIDAAN